MLNALKYLIQAAMILAIGGHIKEFHDELRKETIKLYQRPGMSLSTFTKQLTEESKPHRHNK